jgi:hypothetical protein
MFRHLYGTQHLGSPSYRSSCALISSDFKQMARRAKVFKPVEDVEYRKMIGSSFDWPAWIERETRKR